MYNVQYPNVSGVSRLLVSCCGFKHLGQHTSTWQNVKVPGPKQIKHVQNKQAMQLCTLNDFNRNHVAKWHIAATTSFPRTL